MKSGRVVTSVLAGISGLMTIAAAAMVVRAASRLQLATAGLVLAVSSLAAVLLCLGPLHRWLRSALFPPGFRLVGGSFCVAAALITSLTEKPAFLSFSQLNAAWLLLAGCLLLVTVLADWRRWGGGPP